MHRLKTLAITTSAVLGIVGLTAGTALAAQHGPFQNRATTLVNAIAQKFNLNPADVQQVFDEQRQNAQAQRDEQYASRLDKAVKNEKLTQAQADAIKAKLQELKTFMDGLKDKTPQERTDALKTKMDEVQQWLKDQNIPPQYLPFFAHGRGRMAGPKGPMEGRGHMGGPRGMMGRGR